MSPMTLRDKKVLILGGLGFIGSNLAIRCVESGASVTLVDSMLPKYGGNLHNIEPVRDRVRINFSDIRDPYSMDYLVRDQDVIYSVAGQTSHIESMREPVIDLEINCKSQLTLLESCRRHNPGVTIVYASTRQIYGKPRFLPVTEDHPLAPVDVNGVNKIAAEHYYTLYSNVYGMRCVSLRLTNTLGPRQQLRGNAQGFAGIFIRKALSGEPIQVFGTGMQKRDFNYIYDVVDAMVLSVGNDALKGGAFNLGHPRTYTLIDFVEALKKICSSDYEIVPFPEDHKVIDIGDYYADFSRFSGLTGWTPQVDLEEGLRRTIEYFRPVLSQYS
jgi:UDP-glucose 4-epimerase